MQLSLAVAVAVVNRDEESATKQVRADTPGRGSSRQVAACSMETIGEQQRNIKIELTSDKSAFVIRR